MQWQVCTPETIATGGWGGFSAVGYFYGRDLYEALHVPIGLIESDWGETSAQAWTSGPALRKSLPEYDKALDNIAAVSQSEA